MPDCKDGWDEPVFCFDNPADAARVEKKLRLFLQYHEEYNGVYPDTFLEDLKELYVSVDREFEEKGLL